MKRSKVADMTMEQLIKRFTAIAIDQDKALRSGKHAKFNRLFGEMETVNEELKSRADDQRQRRVGLYAMHIPTLRFA